MTAVALVPARGGSKGIPRKNLAEVGGRPLLAHTVAAAQAASRIDRVVVSTDDDEITAVALQLGAEVLARPAELASDDAGALGVLRHAAEALGLADDDLLVYLQPTSPLRAAASIDGAVELLGRTGADAVVSVVEVPHQFSPASLLEPDGHWLVPLRPDAPLRRQDKPTFLARNGPAVLVLPVATLAGDRLYPSRTAGFLMGSVDSIDVDDAEDLWLVDAVLRARSGS